MHRRTTDRPLQCEGNISLLQQPCTSGTKDDDPILNHHFSLCCILYVSFWTEFSWPSDSLLQNEILMLAIMKANSLLDQDATQSRNSYQTARSQVTEAIFFKAIKIWAPAMVVNFVNRKTNTSFTVTLLNRFYQLASSSKTPVQYQQAYRTLHQNARFLVRTRDFSLTNRSKRLWSPPSNFIGFR
jgi:hypothetical protein